MGEIDFSRVKPLACGAAHRRLYRVTGFEDSAHWCNLALGEPTTQKPAATPPPPTGGYRLTEWSSWGRAAGVDYRYRVGWDPASGGPAKTLDAVYEVRNRGSQQWSGAARSLECAQGMLGGQYRRGTKPGTNQGGSRSRAALRQCKEPRSSS
jgi:hypothetical protein